MDLSTLAGAAITAIVTGAFTKAGEPLGKGVSDKVTQLFALIKAKFRSENIDGMITRLEKQPTEANIERVKAELVVQLNEDQAFTTRVLSLLEQIRSQPGSQQIEQAINAENDINQGNINQVSKHGRPANQSIRSNINSKGSVKLGDINQEQ